jgi:AraC-like DNA-binding protein
VFINVETQVVNSAFKRRLYPPAASVRLYGNCPMLPMVTQPLLDNAAAACSATRAALAQSTTHDDTTHHERRWQASATQADSSECAIVSKWAGPVEAECSALSLEDKLVISVFPRAVSATISIDGTILHHGVISAGSVLVTLPGQVAAGVFAAATEALHLYIDWDFVVKHAGKHASEALGNFYGLFRDDAIGSLARALEYCHSNGCAPGWAERLGAFMVARLFHLHCHNRGRRTQRARIAMPLWRIKRVNDYLEAHLSEPISLADLARVAALSPMHFAARFRLATGHRPHEYLQLRRIERAKNLLLRPGVSLIDIALAVGFRTQSHFSTVFKRYVGHAPSYWRDLQRMNVI